MTHSDENVAPLTIPPDSREWAAYLEWARAELNAARIDGAGQQMPPAQPPLTPEQLDLIRARLDALEEEHAREQSQAILMATYGPSVLARIAALREQHPTWPYDAILEAARREVNADLGDIMSSMTQLAIWQYQQQHGGDTLVRYTDELYAQATEYRPDLAPQRTVTTAEQWRNLRIGWWRYIELATAATRWRELDTASRENFLRALVDHIPWGVLSEGAGRELEKRARERGISRERAKREALLAGAAMVLDRWGEAQERRFGKKWATGQDGKKTMIVPSDLCWLDGWMWFCDEVRTVALADLLGNPYPAYDRDAKSAPYRDVFDVGAGLRVPFAEERDGVAPGHDEGAEEPGDSPPPLLGTDELLGSRDSDNPLTLLTDAEIATPCLLTLLAQLKPRERQVLALLFEGYSVEDAAEELGITPNNVYQIHHRIKKRYRQITDGTGRPAM